MEKLPPEFSEFLKLLNGHGVRHLVIGGYAVAYHGYSRFTAGIDGVQFEDCFPQREVATIGDQEISFISRDDLKRYKAASGRPKDLADLDRL